MQNSPDDTSELLPFGANSDILWDWRFPDILLGDSSLLFLAGFYYVILSWGTTWMLKWWNGETNISQLGFYFPFSFLGELHRFIHLIIVLKNRKKNCQSSRKNTIMNWESFHKELFKIKCLLSTLNIHPLQITLRENSKLRYLNQIKFWIIGGRIDRVQGRTLWWIDNFLIRNHSKWSANHKLWTSISCRSLWEKIPSYNFSIWSKFWKSGRRIDRVQGRTPWLIEKVFISNHSKWSAYSHLWTSILYRSLWEKIPS